MKETKSSHILDRLIDLNLFNELRPDELARVSEYLQLMEFADKERIFGEGEQGSFACFVVEGHLEVCKENEGRRSVSIAHLGRGRSIGEMALIDGSPRSASVVAVGSGTLLLLQRKRFEELLETHPRIGVRLLLRLARMISLNLRRASATVAELLPA